MSLRELEKSCRNVKISMKMHGNPEWSGLVDTQYVTVIPLSGDPGGLQHRKGKRIKPRAFPQQTNMSVGSGVARVWLKPRLSLHVTFPTQTQTH